MKIFVNGKEFDAAGAGTVADLVRQRGLDPAAVVIEHNLVILPGDAWERTPLAAGDRVEVVAFVGGG